MSMMVSQFTALEHLSFMADMIDLQANVSICGPLEAFSKSWRTIRGACIKHIAIQTQMVK